MSHKKSAHQVRTGVGVAAGALLAAAMIPVATAPEAAADDAGVSGDVVLASSALDALDPGAAFGDYGGSITAFFADELLKITDISHIVTALPGELTAVITASIDAFLFNAMHLDLSNAAGDLVDLVGGTVGALGAAGFAVTENVVEIPLEPFDFLFGFIP